MIIASISKLRKYNFTNELKFYLVNLECIHFHQVCVFPYNILVMVRESDASAESYIYCKDSGVRHELKSRRYYFIPSGVSVEYMLNPNIRYYTFHVGLELSPGFDLFSSSRDIITGDAEARIREMDGIFQEKDDFLAICRLREFFLHFFIEHWPSEYPSHNEKSPEFTELLEYVKNNSNATMTVEDLAERVGMTPEAFSRKFHRIFKVSPKSFISKCVLEKITSDLCSSSKSIKDISDELHFSSEFYLSRFFKKHTGIPPSSYKNIVHK